jgi:DNA-binding NarL/FixJ family response regulator
MNTDINTHTLVDRRIRESEILLGLRRLSRRERQVCVLVGRGLSNKEIATGLRIAVKTVDFYRQRVYRKLDVHNVVELTHCAIRLGLVRAGALSR